MTTTTTNNNVTTNNQVTTANTPAASDFTAAAVRKTVKAAAKAVEKKSDITKGYTASWGGAIRWVCNASENNGTEGATIRTALGLTTDSNKAARRAAALRAAKYMPYYISTQETNEDGTTHEVQKPAALRRVATLDNGNNVYQAVIMTDYTTALVAAVRNMAVKDTTIFATIDARRKALAVIAAPTASDVQRKRATERAAALASEIATLYAARHTHGTALALDTYYIGKKAENAHVANEAERVQAEKAIAEKKRINEAYNKGGKKAAESERSEIDSEKAQAAKAEQVKAEKATEHRRRAAVKESKAA